MDIGLLLTINFLSIPFINEAEILGKNKKFPSFLDILKLKHGIREKWFKLYLIFMIIFISIAFFPTKNEEKFQSDIKTLIFIILLQAIVWGLVYFRINNLKNKD